MNLGSNLPYLSIVVTARNDEHGGNFLHRMQIFVGALLEQCKTFQLNCELIIVEWNPPSDHPRLAQALKWPQETGPCTARIIEVPHRTHERFRYSDRLQLFQMIAKNVGIRRAHGRFILATNVDIIFSNELMRFLSTQSLRSDCMYRVDRYGIDPAVPTQGSTDELLDYCAGHIRYVNARNGTYSAQNLGKGQGSAVSIPIPDQIYFALGALPAGDSSLEFGGGQVGPGSRLLEWLKRYVRSPYPISQLHLNACGDFTLLARERWFALRGYPELQMYSLHIDSMLCCMAYEAGLREVILPNRMRIYHMDHAPGIASERRFKEIMDITGVPILLWPQVRAWMKRMHDEETPIIFNDDEWGLATDVLTEHVLHRRKGSDTWTES